MRQKHRFISTDEDFLPLLSIALVTGTCSYMYVFKRIGLHRKFYFEIGSHLAQTGLELALQIRLVMNSRYPPASQEDGRGKGIKQFALGYEARKLPTWDLFHINYQTGLHQGKLKTCFGSCSTFPSPTSPKGAIHIPITNQTVFHNRMDA